MKTFRKTVTAAAMTALLGFGGAASANVIDLFTDPTPGSQTVASGGLLGPIFPSQSEYFNNNGSIIGDYRDLALRDVTDTNDVNGARLSVSSGRLSFANDPNVRSTAIVQWDGGAEAVNPGNLQFGLNGADLINQTGCPVSGCTYFQSIVYDADQGFTIQLGVYESATVFSTLTFVSTEVAVATPSIFLFEWFDTAGANQEVEPGFFVTVVHGSGGKADFTQVNALELQFSNAGGNAAIDLEIGAIEKYGVPEPGTLALAGLAMLGAGMARRRSQAKA